MSAYYHELCLAMNLLADDERTLFLGQGVGCEGTSMASTFKEIPAEKRLEMPVAEELQMGMAVGMSLRGIIPIAVYPRWNFVLRAADAIVNHLDRLSLYSDYRPKVIIRTAVPSKSPFNPGPQHDDDFTGAFRSMLRTTDVVCLCSESDIVPQYQKALHSPRSTILVEFTERYRSERGRQK